MIKSNGYILGVKRVFQHIPSIIELNETTEGAIHDIEHYRAVCLGSLTEGIEEVKGIQAASKLLLELIK